MERRGPQGLNRKQNTQFGHRAESTGPKSKLDFKLELETNSWLRISLSAKDLQKKFTNLFCHVTVVNLREAFHALDGSKAKGIDGITKRDYARKLDENLADLVERLHKGTYRPLPKKRVFIPKANGKQGQGPRWPIAISAFEDKLVEWLLAKLLSSVYEPLFIRNSFGFRPKRSAHDAIKAAYCSLKDNKRPHVVEIDLAKFFDTVSHRKLMRLVKRRITDPRIHGLIARFLKAGVLDQDGNLEISDVGTPQGSVMSPVLANVFLHYALDQWFIENHASKGAIIVRYADDAVFIFEKEEQAKGFKDELKIRLENFGLQLNEDKSGIIQIGKTSGNVFHFLGFTFYWGKMRGSAKSQFRVKTEKGKLFKKIQDYQDWLKENRSYLTLNDIWRITAAKLRGHYNYYGVHTNRHKLNHYYYSTIGLLFRWLNRRSQRKSFTWEKFAKRLQYYPLPTPPQVTSLKPLIDTRIYAY